MPRNIRVMNILVKHHYPQRDLAPADAPCDNANMNIAAIRKRRHLTQEHLAEMIGASQATISRAEKGDDGVTIQQYRAIAAALKVPLWELFADNLTTEEALLLEAYRRLEPARQTGWLEVARALAEDRQLPSQ